MNIYGSRLVVSTVHLQSFTLSELRYFLTPSAYMVSYQRKLVTVTILVLNICILYPSPMFIYIVTSQLKELDALIYED
jgi:hypothetical protein